MIAAVCAGFGSDFPTHLDQHITHLENLNYEVLVVLGDRHSEQILRHSRRLEHCELVFDTHGDHNTLLTNIRAAAFATEDAFLVCNALDPLAPAGELQELINAFYRAGFRTPVQGFWIGSLPLLITRSGNLWLRDHSDLGTLVDSGLQLAETSAA
jgi:hypothetical protein